MTTRSSWWMAALTLALSGCFCPEPRPDNDAWRPCDLDKRRLRMDQDPQSPYVLGYTPFCRYQNGKLVEKTEARLIGRFDLCGATKDGKPIDRLTLSGGELSGRIEGSPIAGEALAGVELTARFDVPGDQQPVDAVRLRITEVSVDSGELYKNEQRRTLYRVSYSPDRGESWFDLCPPPPPGTPVGSPLARRAGWSIAVPGFFTATGSTGEAAAWRPSPNHFSLACGLGAVGDCVAWGYRPDAAATSSAELFQACVRMARADYCGDGHDHTCAGTEIGHGADNTSEEHPLGSKGEPMPFEAAWDEHGAICADKLRWNHLPNGCKLPPPDATAGAWCDSPGKAEAYARAHHRTPRHFSWSAVHDDASDPKRCPAH